MNAIADQIVNEMVEAFKTIYKDQLKKVILYGSYARGDNSEYSDIDIAAIVYGERKWVQDKLALVDDIASEIGWNHEMMVSPYAIPYKEFEEYKEVLPYYRNINTEGIIYYQE